MRIVVQRCKSAAVTVNGETVGAIGSGLLLLVGVTHEDTEKDAQWLADKLVGLRIFEDDQGKMNLSVADTGGEVLSVSQFTLYSDCRTGKRPSFMAAARPELAEPLYETFNAMLRAKGLRVETGRFGAMMDVSLVNWGPVTLIVDSRGK
ncbi:D-tyrosyl-tRNA(Tyr) deacylase [Paenibacillus darwinianus]|uniref:D-aminoacyl-tRNA deacylase n=1 Tax=Paenibacillus darwinianus TaxID=1380763 RepID=A0A9W5RZQ5_9BACL|nr:D-aminoacyl-tRNA deacylase [Paenibacillus darwinianus]EXX87122.1 D-tyrosyl-tRNA(Tyr) deacylase [Paenibacillus darwinianus]EXX88538.1 D-tyrosyl-tRNA(Tyr) deacylase [Paenibacillus darwinianus]EXX88763.1 D-tyrosyl-tRNA(Tyr) deacylase [Paenibacillus darwinianus]